MDRTRTIAGVTETLIAAQCVVRRDAGGGGSIAFSAIKRMEDADGNYLGEKPMPMIRADFAELAGVAFPVQMPNGSVSQVQGATILEALESVYDYIKALRDAGSTPPDPV